MTPRNDIESLFKTHYARMYQLAVALLHNPDTARDIIHDVFASLLGQKIYVAPTEAYLLKSVRNRCVNYIRDSEIHQRIHNFWLLENEDFDSTNSPDDCNYDEMRAIIQSELTSRSRKVIELRFYHGMPFSKIAGVMGISETAVYRHLRNALIILRQKLNQNG